MGSSRIGSHLPRNHWPEETGQVIIPFLNNENTNTTLEGWRRAALHVLAVLSGIVTAFMASDYIPVGTAGPVKEVGVVGLGLLASGGSSFWNSIATYVLKVKDLKQIEVDTKKCPCPPTPK